MQIKKFEAPTIQEALETIKRELGPEAIILQTKKHKRGFGLMSRASVEVTAAVSERSMQKKKFVETRMPETSQTAVKKMPAVRQAEIYDKYLDKHLASQLEGKAEKVQLSRAHPPQPARPPTTKRYIDIDDEESAAETAGGPGSTVRSAMKSLFGQPARGAPAGPAGTSSAAGALAGRLGPAPEGGGLNSLSGMSMEDELRHLKRMVEEMKNAQEDSRTAGGATGAQALIHTGSLATPALQNAFEQLVVNGLEKRYALALVQRASFELSDKAQLSPDAVTEQLATELMKNTEVAPTLPGLARKGQDIGVDAPIDPTVFAFVGPTGVGKTTTVAKLAAEASQRRGLKVGLINLDSHKAGAFDQLATFAKILNLPFRSAASVEDLKAGLRDFRAMDVVLVDTTGRSQRDPGSIREMQDLLAAIPGARTHLVLSATTRDTEMYDMAARFSAFRPSGIIVSKLDEATIFGSIYNVSQRAKLPLLYFTTGQRVPEDIEEATKERVASLILEI